MPPLAPVQRSLQLAAFAAVATTVVTGVWVAGGRLTDDFRGSAALTAAWLLLAAVLCTLIARRSRTLRVPVIAAYVLTAGAVGVFLASTTLRDRVVSERVVTGADPASADAAGPPGGRANVRLAHGRFRSGEHATRGTAAVVRLADGRRFLTLTAFATSPGPDLRVRLGSSRTLDGDGPGTVDLGALKGNRGDQQYRIPAGLDLHGRAVIIWCRAFSARFGSAILGDRARHAARPTRAPSPTGQAAVAAPAPPGHRTGAAGRAAPRRRR